MKEALSHKSSLILLRGLPGSGKSTLALLLSENGKYPIVSIDTYFTNSLTDEYSFDYTKNHLAYKQCEEQTRGLIKMGSEKIFIANTFTMDWEMEPYFLLASQYNYKLFVITVENHHGNKNIHKVSQEQIEKMASKYKVKLF